MMIAFSARGVHSALLLLEAGTIGVVALSEFLDGQYLDGAFVLFIPSCFSAFGSGVVR